MNKKKDARHVASEAASGTKKKSRLTTLALVLMLVVGTAIMAYPTFSNWWNSFHQTRVIAGYSAKVEQIDQESIDAMIDAARAYNASLPLKENPFAMTDEDMERYNSLLDISGTGVMGYVQIPSIKVDIPIYHGTGNAALQTAVGHIDWTSLPVGGEGTHAAISGHRGLPRARLFTDLDQLKEGDTFTITVLNYRISYEIDQIRIVDPGDVSDLIIVPGEDYCTLVTCTPYGINTHRLLLRGHRVANEDGEMLVVAPEAYRIPNYLTIPAVAIPLLFLFLLGMLIYYRHRRPELEDPEDLEIKNVNTHDRKE